MSNLSAEAFQAFVVKYRGSIEKFVDECMFTPADKRRVSTQQRRVLRDIDSGSKDIAIKSGHGTGKTAIMAWVTIWAGLFHLSAKIPQTAPTAPQLIRLLIPEIRLWRDKLPYEFQDVIDIKQDHVTFDTQSFAVARTARPEAPEGLQGFHADFLVWIVDEASGVPNSIFEVIDGSLTGERHLRLLTANPTRTEGYFYDIFHKNRDLWSCHTFNAEESENVSKESIRRKVIQYGEDSDAYRVRVKGEFPRSNDDSVIPLYIIDDAIARDPKESNHVGAEVWGLDYADAGSDTTQMFKRVGHNFYECVKCPAPGSHRQAATADWLALQYNQAARKPKAIFIDAIGEGSGLISILQLSHYSNLPVIPVKASSTASNQEVYANKRAELFYRLKGMLEDEGSMIDDDELIGELSAQKFVITPGGKLQLIPKKDIKESLGRSPDKADAMALCCAEIIITEEEILATHERRFDHLDGEDTEVGSW